MNCILRKHVAERFFLLLVFCASAFGANPPAAGLSPSMAVSPADLGVAFVPGSTSQILVQKNGKTYIVDVATHSIHEAESTPAADPATSSSSKANAQQQQPTPAQADANANPGVYEAGDDLVFSVPTGRRLDRHGFYINFTHRFPYSTAFKGQARGAILDGLDDVAVPSFGFRYGLTSKFSIAAYRSPSLLGRPIELMAAYNLLDEHDGQPFNAAVRFSIDGQNDFQRNFTENFELVVSKSITHRAQIYAVPTISIHNRPLVGSLTAVTDPPPYQPCSAAQAGGILPPVSARPCANTFSLGVAAAVDVRPTVALVAEAIPTLVNGPELGIHRPAYAFGIQKKIWRHAFTFGFTNSPGTDVSQRAGTRATYLNDPTADKPSGMFLGFDLSRQTH
ncbi:MAG TPA: DUF5777 family beta-barrel protein [Terriglobales bacterium]